MTRKRSNPLRNPGRRRTTAPDSSASTDRIRIQPSLPFPVVGVGASAGGIEASTQLLQALPANTGMAFVFLHHLAPDRSSLLADIMARATSMKVETAEDDMAVEPNHVYVIPPATDLELADGELKLYPRTRTDGSYRPIDRFLTSLAAEQGHRSIGIILSGTANDGTRGCEEIKAAGGITFAQDESAQQESMPRSAIATGGVDFVLPPAKIASEITRIGKHPMVAPAEEDQPVEVPEDRLAGILGAVRTQTGVDFTDYKRSTVVRRIARRMVLHRIEGTSDYEGLVANTPAEAEALFQDILINVTSFFRNPEGFELLKKKVFPELIRDRSPQIPVRIWILGCATGEEAYSVAMAFTELTAAQRRAIPVQIFASDLSPTGVERARAGLYPKSIEHDVTPERLRQFFQEADGGYKVIKAIRDMVVFARHNALQDPPFSHIDLITCRNVLIYLGSLLQQRLIPVLHYALNPGGYLWLGHSETVGSHHNLFDQVDLKEKLYQRKPVPPQIRGLVALESRPVQPKLPGDKRSEMALPGIDPYRESDRLLLSRYAPPGVLVNAEFEILHYRGDTSDYLTPLAGRASLSLLKMLREGLLVGVRAALLKARREERPVRSENLPLQVDELQRKVSVEVIPVRSSSMRETVFLVLFDDAASARARAKPTKPQRVVIPRGEKAAAEVVRLRQELAATREYLQSVIEQQEAVNEELQSANEEVQSSNEELQSINEELETSKEEIQSSSEELATVNDELSNRNLELARSNNDLTNLISSVQIPIVMLGQDFRIRWFTASAERLLNLITTDIGRPITDIKPNIELPGLEAMLVEVMDTVTAREQIVRDRKGRWYSLRLRPYRTLENKVDGVVLLLVDIDDVKAAEASIRQNLERLSVLHDQAPLGIREVDLEGRYLKVNQQYCAITGYSREELIGHRFEEFIPSEDRGPAVELSQRVLRGETATYRQERRHLHKSGRAIWVEVHGFALRDTAGKPVAGVAFVQDIEERKHKEAELQAADRSKNEFLAMLAHELRNPLAPLLNAAQLLGSPDLTRERLDSLRGIFERQIRNLSRMTDDLLDISRISRGQLRLHLEVVEIGAIVRRAVDLYRPSIENRGQRLEIQIPDETLQLEVDPVRIEQVVDNLLTNASKFSDPGGVIRVSLVRSPEPAPGVLELRVRDQGKGIPPELLPRVFEPFIQEEQSLDRVQGGLGLGLTLVRSIVQLHGGTVEARSGGLEQGAEFVVGFPVPARPPEPRPERRQAGRNPRSRRILVVDDNPDASETLAMLLHHAGHDVRTADDGDAGIEQAAVFHPEIVLLDIGLPGRDGIEVARELRAKAGAHPLHIVAVSGYGQDELRARARDAGIDQYFTKPVDVGNLLRLFATLP